MFSNDILNIHIILSSTIDAIWMKTHNEKMMSSFLLPHHCLLVKYISNIWLQLLFHIGYEVISYDYNELCSCLEHLIIDFLVAKNKITFSEKFIYRKFFKML
jgi:hypothetical protein